MGIFDKTANILLRFKADTDQAIANTKKLGGMQAFAAQATVDAQKTASASYAKWAEGAADLGAGIGLITTAIKLGGDAWAEYEQAAKSAGDEQAAKAGEMRDAINEWNASMKDAKVAIGELVVSLAPFISSLAQTVSLIAQIAAGVQQVPGIKQALAPGGPGRGGPTVGGTFLDFMKIPIKGVIPFVKDLNQYRTGGDYDVAGHAMDALVAYVNSTITDGGRGGLQTDGRSWDSYNHPNRPLDKEAFSHQLDWNNQPAFNRFGVPRAGIGDAWGQAAEGTGGGGGYDLFAHGGSETSWGKAPGGASQDWLDARVNEAIAKHNLKEQIQGIQDRANTLGIGREYKSLDFEVYAKKAARITADLRQEHKDSVLAAVFGPLKDWDAYQEKMQALADAVGVFSGALQGSFDAWVSGSLSASAAIKKFLSDAISGIASKMFAKALEHGAEAIGDLAGGNLVGAALHGKAAAAFAAGALAVGAIARKMGGGGSGGSGGSSGGAGGSASAPSVGGYGGGMVTGPPRVTNVYVGDGMSQSGPRWERQRAVRSYNLARREATDSDTVRWS